MKNELLPGFFGRPLFLGLMLLCLSACFATREPIPSLSYPGSEQAQRSKGKKLLVALRGMGGSHESFEKHNFIQQLQDKYPEFDVVAPNAHFGYYRKRSIIDRLNADIINPAIADGYEEIWLAGVSMGGLGSLLYLRCCESKLAGVVLLAPFSGSKGLHRKVGEALQSNEALPWAEEKGPEHDSLEGMWSWLLANRELLAGGRVWMAYGTEDGLAGLKTLAQLLPEDQVITMDGGHKIKIFSELWQRVLAKDPMHPDALNKDL